MSVPIIPTPPFRVVRPVDGTDESKKLVDVGDLVRSSLHDEGVTQRLDKGHGKVSQVEQASSRGPISVIKPRVHGVGAEVDAVIGCMEEGHQDLNGEFGVRDTEDDLRPPWTCLLDQLVAVIPQDRRG